jgi:hypothetical protein
MANNDTVYLLKECDAGSKMAVSSIDDMLDKVRDSNLKKLLTESREHHEKLGNDLHSILNQYKSEEKEPNIMAKGMSYLKTNMKLSMDECDATIADLITDGCNMGIKSLYKYLNQYSDADPKAKELCMRLIRIEQELRKDMRNYL